MNIVKTDKVIIYQTIELSEYDLQRAVEYWLENEKQINGVFYGFEIIYNKESEDIYKAEISVKRDDYETT